MGKTQTQFLVPDHQKEDLGKIVDVVPASQISTTERRSRAEAVALARASMQLEGFHISPEAEAMKTRFINGEVTLDECIGAVKKTINAS